MEIKVKYRDDEEFVKDIVKPFIDVFKELMKLVKKFDDEINNITNNAHVRVTVDLYSWGHGGYNADYYAIIYPDSVSIYCDLYRDDQIEDGEKETVYIATIYI